jgi:acyl-CoA thioester hydrolase
MKHCHESLAEYPLVLTIPVLLGDLDAFGHVNNLAYLRWCETARVDYLARTGLWVPLPPQGIGPILASLSCDYRRPVNHPDTMHVGARVTKIGNSSVKMDHIVVSEALAAVVAEVQSTIVMVDYSRMKSAPVPQESRRAIEELERKVFA